MKRIAVNSRNVVSIGYAEAIGVLEVEFQNGSIYQFIEVSSSVYAELMQATSIGDYFASNIMDNYYCQQTYPATR